VDYQTAQNILIRQGLDAAAHPDSLISHLRQGKPPLPGQVTEILLALKVVFEALREATAIDRELAYSLFLLATESRKSFAAGHQSGLEWPPLLDEDLERINADVQSIFRGQ
jgi:hypothetical protein